MENLYVRNYTASKPDEYFDMDGNISRGAEKREPEECVSNNDHTSRNSEKRKPDEHVDMDDHTFATTEENDLEEYVNVVDGATGNARVSYGIENTDKIDQNNAEEVKTDLAIRVAEEIYDFLMENVELTEMIACKRLTEQTLETRILSRVSDITMSQLRILLNQEKETVEARSGLAGTITEATANTRPKNQAKRSKSEGDRHKEKGIVNQGSVSSDGYDYVYSSRNLRSQGDNPNKSKDNLKETALNSTCLAGGNVNKILQKKGVTKKPLVESNIQAYENVNCEIEEIRMKKEPLRCQQLDTPIDTSSSPPDTGNVQAQHDNYELAVSNSTDSKQLQMHEAPVSNTKLLTKWAVVQGFRRVEKSRYNAKEDKVYLNTYEEIEEPHTQGPWYKKLPFFSLTTKQKFKISVCFLVIVLILIIIVMSILLRSSK